MTLRRLVRSEAVLTVASRIIGLYLDVAIRTTRWRLVADEATRPLLKRGPAIVAFWHEHLALMPALCRLGPTGPDGAVHVLISRHRDGQLVSMMVRRLGAEVVAGSSDRSKDGRATDRGGADAFRRMLTLLAARQHVALTPDGPRGPRHRAAPGLARLAARSGAPVLPCAAQTNRRVILPTWDRLVVPLPFGRGTLVVGTPLATGTEGDAAWTDRMEAALADAGARAGCAR